MSQRRIYWLNLPRNFLKRPEIKCILEASHGGEVLLMYLELLCESLDTQGLLRIDPQVPYTPEILGGSMGIHPAVAAMGLRLLRVLDLVRVTEDGTLFMTQQPLMMGSECISAERVRNYRARRREKNHSHTCPPLAGGGPLAAREVAETPQPLALPLVDNDYGEVTQKPRQSLFFTLIGKAKALLCNLLPFQKKPE